MNIGDLVKYCEDEKSLSGIIKEKKGKKWVKVLWADNVIFSEHVDDLQVIGAAS
tara:strand:- start:10627 stop:10788 length:162 start_codon:yes stop_codon:yes gene_type:complete